MQECIDALIRVLDAKCNDGEKPSVVDINNIMGNLTFVSDVVGSEAFC
jgi:hypothetical protein